MRKMVFVPESYVDELNRLRLETTAKLPPKPELLQAVSTQREMEELLNDPGITAGEKARRYGELMLRYNSFKKQVDDDSVLTALRQPDKKPETALVDVDVKPIVKKEKKEKKEKIIDTRPPVEDSDIVSSVPASYRGKASSLLSKIKGLGSVSWDHNGELIVNGAPLKGSNISDLINDGVRFRVGSPKAIGWETLVRELGPDRITRGVWNQTWLDYVDKSPKRKTESPSQKGSGKRQRWESWP